jgi:opacity protein-like surface antigen
MKHTLNCLMLIAASCITSVTMGQTKDFKPKFGLKAGYNISKITGSTPNFSPDNKSGFMFAGFYSAGGVKSGFGYRTELVFSRQGYSYDSSGTKINVKQDYLYLPQFTTFNISKYFQIQAGVQLGLLLNAVKTKDSSGAAKVDIMDIYNKIDYGLAAGVEVYPIKSVIIGARYNISLGNMYKRQEEQLSNPQPFPLPFNPDELKGKNAVINFYAGIRF